MPILIVRETRNGKRETLLRGSLPEFWRREHRVILSRPGSTRFPFLVSRVPCPAVDVETKSLGVSHTAASPRRSPPAVPAPAAARRASRPPRDTPPRRAPARPVPHPP